ncbi:phenolic acid decarboxylase [Afifella sp. H1R]|uniref:phenolic acid decarboxylase n=1 Tax=unclassified Afifella TaxID=2624128 RepID=UPI001F30D17D|nr:phenolic acid decarboxylase [Afifella sp. H1R]MCF1505323.1 phenolic acid decarboxylase [Afifella sp. H1R]
MSEDYSSTRPEELKPFLGRHFIYTYDNGWQYEMYIKNADTIDYRIHSGMVGGRWVRDQKVHLARLSDDVIKVSWDEPTGTSVSVSVNFAERQLHGVIFFPQWIAQDPKKTVCFQNEHLDEMRAFRDAGPTYPKLVIDEFAKVTFLETCAVDDETVVAVAPEELPEGYASRT